MGDQLAARRARRGDDAGRRRGRCARSPARSPPGTRGCSVARSCAVRTTPPRGSGRRPARRGDGQLGVPVGQHDLRAPSRPAPAAGATAGVDSRSRSRVTAQLARARDATPCRGRRPAPATSSGAGTPTRSTRALHGAGDARLARPPTRCRPSDAPPAPGFRPTTACAGTSSVTTALAPTYAPSPRVTPASTALPMPRNAPRPIDTGRGIVQALVEHGTLDVAVLVIGVADEDAIGDQDAVADLDPAAAGDDDVIADADAVADREAGVIAAARRARRPPTERRPGARRRRCPSRSGGGR